MKKAIYGLFLFIFIWSATIALSHYLNYSMKSIQNGSRLPIDIESSQYSVSGLSAAYSTGDCYISFSGASGMNDLTLVLSDAADCSVYQDDTLLYNYHPKELYQRVITIPLKTKADKINLRIHSAHLTDNFLPDATGGMIPRLKIAIGASKLVAFSTELANFINSFSLGIYATLILTMMLLFVNKKSETYLFAIALVALASFCATVLTSGFATITVSQEAYQRIRKIVVVFPLVPNSAFSLYLISSSFTEKLRKQITIRNTVLMTILAILIQAFSSINLYHIYRWAFLIPTLIGLVYALKKGNKDAIPLLIGSGICEGLHSYVYLVNSLRILQAGAPIIYLRYSQPGYLANQLTGIFVICKRFAQKFSEAQTATTQLQLVNQSLDKKIEERTQALLAEQERRHGMMLNIFHDLRSPIFILRGCLATLEKKTDTSPEEYGIMHDRLNFLDQLIEDLFLLAKFETNEFPFDFDEISLSSIIENTVSGTRILAQEKKITLNVEITDNVVIWGDSIRLREMLQNLLNNAIRHTSPNGFVSLSLLQLEHDAVIMVKDNGEGIQPEDIPHIFERYYRSPINASRDRSFGLGLSIVKEVVEAHRGSITVDSSPNQGTAFVIRFPLY